MKIVWGRSLGWNIELIRYRNVKVDYYILTDGADCYPWKEVYAWLPVKTISGKRAWMEKLYKRRVWIVWGTGFHMEPEVQYATAFDVLTHDNENNLDTI
jgi:hypothetical protein